MTTPTNDEFAQQSEETNEPIGVDDPKDSAPFNPEGERKVLIQTYDYAVRTLMDMVVEGDIKLDPDYQRMYRWDDEKASCFIETILLNIPVPVLYMAEEPDGKFTVIDGQQRLTSLIRYIRANDIEKMFPDRGLGPLTLDGLKIRADLIGKTYIELDSLDKSALSKRPIRCIVILNESDSSLKFEVFERLNSGSISLTDQEVRNSMYRGSFNRLIKRLVGNQKFQEMIALPTKSQKNMKDAELVLRFFAYRSLDESSSYSESYKEFLNSYMENNREWPARRIEEMEAIFNQTIDLIYECLGRGMAFRKPSDRNNPSQARFAHNLINGALYEAQMVAFSRIVEEGVHTKATADQLKLATLSAFGFDDFWDSLFQGTSQKRRVLLRSKLLTEVLRNACG